MPIESVMPSSHLILSHPLLLLPSIFPSIRVFSNESVLHIRWPKYWSFSFNISPSNEYSGLISFRMEWFDLLAVQGTLKSLLQYHSSKALYLYYIRIFIVHLKIPWLFLNNLPQELHFLIVPLTEWAYQFWMWKVILLRIPQFKRNPDLDISVIPPRGFWRGRRVGECGGGWDLCSRQQRWWWCWGCD